MKKDYSAPALECLEFLSASPFSSEQVDSNLWNDGELGWEGWT